MTAGRSAYTEALVDLTFERGYEALTVAEIVARAEGSEAGFEAHFASKQECAVAALEAMIADNQRTVKGAFESEPRWPDSLR